MQGPKKEEEMKKGNSDFKKLWEKYFDVPKTFILKEDLMIRGVSLTKEAIEKLQEPYYEHTHAIYQWHHKDFTEGYGVPFDLYFKDGTRAGFRIGTHETDPYTIDFSQGKFWLYSHGEPIEEIFFSKRPDFYEKNTSSGVPMKTVAIAKGQDAIMIHPYRYCYYFKEGLQCKFCDMDYNLKLQLSLGKKFKVQVNPQDIYETIKEALKEKGKWRSINMTGGSDPTNGYQKEFEFYLECVKAVKAAFVDMGFNMERVPLAAIMTPLKEDQYIQLYEAGLRSYGANLEVWDKEKFPLVCPGKSKYLGREEWIKRAINAVKIFGKGNVFSYFVAGVEFAPPPYGAGVDAPIEPIIKSNLEDREFLMENGVMPSSCHWAIEPGTDFYKMGATQPPLEFFVKLGREDFLLKKKMGFNYGIDMMCYRENPFTCEADWARLL